MIPLKMTLLQKNTQKPTGLKQKIPAEDNCPDSVHDFTEFTTQPIKDIRKEDCGYGKKSLGVKKQNKTKVWG